MTEMKKRPSWWNALHDRALAALTPTWQRLQELRSTGEISVVTLEDLVVAGEAEVRREPLVVNGIRCGEHTYFRRAA